ncbi:NAD-dependent succinate-semialdehyde dehydrogenase [Pediococcus damnosus]|uniref:NAD-dependent succinate-semialdehyde dehydrogenase n=1 Tax=Pediococcus damnosus TaxID=51663 RepID=UPI000C1FCF64|nr:NAD-dependent succinate-semialdehyde dehydrogenase [Pediococcus damnosus]PJE49198.1 succinate-semialdehyde dehydrogenase [Pediococcus damnosus]
MAYKSVNPYTNETLNEYENATSNEIEAALQTATDLAQSWETVSISERATVLHAVASQLRDEKQAMAETMTREMGKLIGESEDEVDSCASIADYFADHAEEFMQPTEIETKDAKATVLKQAFGPILACEPWNFPLYQVMRIFAPNFMVGNPVILKHASIVPGSARKISQIVDDAGAPEGSLINLFLDYDQIADMIADPRIAGVALTGSERGGKSVAKAAGENLKKSTLELGGNDAFVVLEDVDRELLYKVAPAARLANSGQTCTASKRFIVPDALYDDFMDALIVSFSEMKMGDPLDRTTTLAPMSSEHGKEKLQKQVDEAIANGAEVVYGNESVQAEGQFFMPTILTDITPENPIFDQELFGPVAQVFRVHSEKEAIQLANNSQYGLGSVVMSSDLKHAEEVASQIKAGMTFVNHGWTSLPELPFGGIRNSGYGRELSKQGLMTFVNEHLIYIAENKE